MCPWEQAGVEWKILHHDSRDEAEKKIKFLFNEINLEFAAVMLEIASSASLMMNKLMIELENGVLKMSAIDIKVYSEKIHVSDLMELTVIKNL